jgi:23S rRNA pseudouridine1911/1915/1917 synthase
MFPHLRAGQKKGVALQEGDAAGKSCETRFTVEERFAGYALVRCEPRTGRMHQIRVHLLSEGFPLAYDPLYGRRAPLRAGEFLPRAGAQRADEIAMNRLPLHAWKLAFTHPASGEKMEVEAPLPRDLREFLALLRKGRRGR